MKQKLTIITPIVLIAIWLSGSFPAVYSSSDTDLNKMSSEKKSVMTIDEKTAVEIAKAEALSKNIDITEHLVKSAQADGMWFITFEAPSPRGPGDAITISVDKVNGETYIFYDE